MQGGSCEGTACVYVLLCNFTLRRRTDYLKARLPSDSSVVPHRREIYPKSVPAGTMYIQKTKKYVVATALSTPSRPLRSGLCLSFPAAPGLVLQE